MLVTPLEDDLTNGTAIFRLLHQGTVNGVMELREEQTVTIVDGRHGRFHSPRSYNIESTDADWSR